MNSNLQKLILSLALVGIFLAAQFSSFGTTGDLKSLDLFRTSHDPHPSVVILAIDSKSISQVGRWPWSRTVQAEILNKLSISAPQIVIEDINFSDPESQTADAAFAQALKSADFPVVLAAEAIYQKGQSAPSNVLVPQPQFTSSDNVSVGLANVDLSTDGIARSFPGELNYQSKTYLPLSFQSAKLLKAPIPQGDRFVSYAGSAGTFQTYSVGDVLSGKIGKDQLQDRIVLLGATASDLHDTILVPEQPQVMAGVEYHANTLDNILLQRSIKVLPTAYSRVIGIVMLCLFLLMLFKFPRKITLYVTLALLLILPLVSFILWRQSIALGYFQNTIFAAIFLATYGLYSWYVAEREKRRLRDTFKNYFSPSVMQAIIKDPSALKLGGRRANVTVFFSDIRNFTTISESLPPEKLTDLLHEYFTEMTEEILATDGVVDKFIGDAIMAFWGAPIQQPDQADRAVKASLKMLNKLSKLQTKWQSQGYPFVDIGIGIHSGEATVGNMGSEKRFDYTVIGDSVNVASRLEGLNKEYKTNIIISSATKELLKAKLKTKRLGNVLVKGKTQGVEIYTFVNKSGANDGS